VCVFNSNQTRINIENKHSFRPTLSPVSNIQSYIVSFLQHSFLIYRHTLTPTRRSPLDVNRPSQRLQTQSRPATHPREFLAFALQKVRLVLLPRPTLLSLVSGFVIDFEKRRVEFGRESAGFDGLAGDDAGAVGWTRGGHVEYHLDSGWSPNDRLIPVDFHFTAVQTITPETAGFDSISQSLLDDGVVADPVETVFVDGISANVQIVSGYQCQTSDHTSTSKSSIESPFGNHRRSQMSKETRKSQKDSGYAIRSERTTSHQRVKLHFRRHGRIQSSTYEIIATVRCCCC